MIDRLIALDEDSGEKKELDEDKASLQNMLSEGSDLRLGKGW